MAYFRPAQDRPRPAGETKPTTRPVSPDDVIQIENLTKRFKRTRLRLAGGVFPILERQKRLAVNGLTFSVPPQTLFGFLGPNGAGKSTTLYMLLGLVRPTSGKIRIFNRSVRWRDIRQRIGSLIETPAFYDYLSGRKNLDILGRLTGTTSRVEIDEVLDTVGLLDRAGDKVAAYSDGMKQRLGVAQALLHKPDLLILDEPTNGLDPEGNRDLWLLLRHLVSERGITALVSSHLLAEVEEYCDYVCVIDEGRQVACDTVENLLTFPTTIMDVVFADEVALDAARRCFQRAGWVRMVSDEPSAAGLALRVEFDGPPAELSRLLRKDVVDFDALVPVRRTLREFFLTLTSKGVKTGAGSYTPESSPAKEATP